MNDDQVLGNVMLSVYLTLNYPFRLDLPLDRHQLPRLPPQKELAERQIPPPQNDHGQARPSLLIPL